jgi:probable F420-dependent oxidoreductase
MSSGGDRSPSRADSDALHFAMGVSFQLDELASAGRAIEEAGFDAISCGDHVLFRGAVPSALIVLSYLAAITSRVRLLTGIVLAPLYPASLLAKQTGMLDALCAGRLDVGIGVGGEYRPEFEACGVPITERGARTDEAIAILKHLWSGSETAFEGRWATVPPARINPPPLQIPHPPIWIGGRSTAAMRRTARFGDVWMPYMYTPAMLADSISTIARMATAEGRDPSSIRSSINCFISVGANGNEARRLATHTVEEIYGQDFGGRRSRYLVAGTPTECVEQIAEYLEVGAQGAVFSLVAAPGNELDAIAMIGAEVLPALRAD